jgi:glycerate 2-kinase
VISDVPGDDPSVIASGPTVPDASTLAEAKAILARYQIALPPHVLALLDDPAAETPKPGNAAFVHTQTRLIATPQASLEAAAAVACATGITPVILGDALEGEAAEVGRVMAGIARQVALHQQPVAPPCVLISGGETTVTVRGHGRGGRNVEFLLSLAIALSGRCGISAIAGDTDGVDGADEVAGAIITPDTLARAAALGVSPRSNLDDNNGHGFFATLGDQVITGPTLTNVNDFRAILITAVSMEGGLEGRGKNETSSSSQNRRNPRTRQQ